LLLSIEAEFIVHRQSVHFAVPVFGSWTMMRGVRVCVI